MPTPVEGRSHFGKVLRDLRVAAGFSQEELADRASISKNGISALERGESRAPQRETLSLLMEALQLNPEQRLALEQAAIRPSQPRNRQIAEKRANNLPRVLTSFVGREEEIAEIGALVKDRQLATLVGTGGVGKTRLAVHVASELLGGFDDGAWFIELAPLSSGEYIPSTVAHALEITIACDGSALEALVSCLKHKRSLLVFDNCEHLVRETAAVIAAILRSCPNIRILATSRQRLGLAGETAYQVPSLAISSAVALFTDRARAVDRRFSVTDETAKTIEEICLRLDTIPLAIELAASRANILSPQQLHERLCGRFRILTGGARDVPSRQQTLRALIDWSYDLLDEPERMLFRRLGIFANGFTIEGAAVVVSLGELDAFDVLASLIDKSLVLVDCSGDANRYRLLESTRLYAREKLTEAGEWDDCERRRLRHIQALFFQIGERYERSAKISEISSALATEIEDVRGALDWAVENDPLLGAKLLADIRPFWRALGLHGEGITRIQTMLAALKGDHHCQRARLYATISFLAGEVVERTLQTAAAAQAMEHARLCNDSSVLVEALLRFARGAANARRFEEAEAALREAGSVGGLSAAMRVQLLGVKVVVSMLAGDLAAASDMYECLHKEYRSLGNVTEDRGIILNLAEIEHARGRTQQAIGLIREALDDLRTIGDRMMLATALANCAGYLNAVDDASAASAMARDAIRELAPAAPHATDVAVAIEHLALASALSGDLIRAATLEGYADAALRRLDFKREFTEAMTHERLLKLLNGHLASDDLAQRLAAGQNLAPEEVIAFALELH